MSTPTPPHSGLPRFFLDRNLGRFAVPRGLRAAGIEVVAIAERYGVPCRRKNPEERRVLLEARLRTFIVSSQLPATEVIGRFLVNLAAIERACRQPGPFVYRLHPERIERRQIRR